MLTHSKAIYYFDVIVALFEIIALYLCFTYARKYKTGKLFILYIAFDFCILLIGWLFSATPSISKQLLSQYYSLSNTTVALVELLVYYYYFTKVLNNQKIKKALIILSVLYTIIVFVFITTKFFFITHRFSYIGNFIGVIEFCLLLPPCILYFIQILKNVTIEPLLQKPSFWIVLGIFFYSLISIPFYLILSYFKEIHLNNTNLYLVFFFYLPFAINFIFLSKAFLCKKPLTI